MSFVRHLNRNKEAPINGRSTSRSKGSTTVEVAQYNDTYTENVPAFGDINTVDGGTHVTGFRAALTVLE